MQKHMYAHVYVRTYVGRYVCMYVIAYVCMFIYIYIYRERDIRKSCTLSVCWTDRDPWKSEYIHISIITNIYK